MMIQSEAHHSAGEGDDQLRAALASPQSDLVQQTLKDPYIFDFLTLRRTVPRAGIGDESSPSTRTLPDRTRARASPSSAASSISRSATRDFYIDLFFYHLKLRCFFVIDLKKGEFKPEHAGKMNFYLSVVDDRLRHETDAPSIGLILCQDRNQIIAEYALRGADRPIGISEYELTRALPAGLKSALPTVEEIEAELKDAVSERQSQPIALPAPAKHKAAKTSEAQNRKPKTENRKLKTENSHDRPTRNT